MPHRRSEQQLHKNQADHHDQPALDRHKTGPVVPARPVPPTAGDQRNSANQDQEQLRHRPVDQAKVRVDLRHPQPAEDALPHDQQHGPDTQPAHPFTVVLHPNPDGQNDRQQPDKRRHQPVRMLLEHPKFPEPLVKRNEEHVVAEGVGPVRHRHPHPLARHQTAEPNQDERRQSRGNGESVQPRGVLRSSSHSAKQIGRIRNLIHPIQAARNVSPKPTDGNLIVK